MVVGGGIAGVQASLDLADAGFYVYLVEKSEAIGGTMAQLDKTFPTNDCSMCILSPKLVEVDRHPNIQLVTMAQLVGLEGEAGNFKATVVQEPRYVDPEKCIACGQCAERCPVKIPDPFNEGVGERKLIGPKYAQAVPSAYAILDPKKCLYLTKGVETGKPVCRLCEKVCDKGAVNLEDTRKTLTFNVGAVILAPGFDEFDPSALANYGYGKFKNVVTSIEFERILSASGPFAGHLVRPSDHKEPKKIAWIQCVGSRDKANGSGYCSSVCCTYAIKEAVIAKEHAGEDLDTAIFYIDMRTYGKGFEAYYNSAKRQGVRFIQSKIHSIDPGANEGDLSIRYIGEDGQPKREDFDMVVLSVGLRPAAAAVETAKKLGIDLNEYNFCRTSTTAPVETSRPGVYVCGLFQSPMDIPQSVMQASAAAGAAQTLLAPARGTLVKKEPLPPEVDVRGEAPRIGVFVCHCGINIAGVVNVEEVRDYAATLPHVVYATNNLYTCSSDTQETIKNAIKEHNLNRVVVASCTPRTHEPLFQATIAEAGLNPYLFELANIREHCSWVHMKDKEAATAKAKEIVRRAVAKVALAEPLYTVNVDIERSALVIGGGIAGMTAALDLADQGFQVYLVERQSELGGMARRIHYTLEGLDVQAFLKDLVGRVTNHPKIKVFTNATVKNASGYVGNFVSTVDVGGQTQDIKHGVVIIAIGGREYRPTEYLYGQDPRVMTGLELEEKIAAGAAEVKSARNVVMIQCVGSRVPEREYCSRVCCGESVKNALKLKELNPDVNVYILYRDMRTYGFKEDYFEKARSQGVVFVRYSLENLPEVKNDGGVLKVSVYDPVLHSRVEMEADILALAVATLGAEGAHEVGQLYKVTCGYDGGFFLEAHMKLRPVDFATDGAFLAGLAHGPKYIEEAIAQGRAAASRAATVLTRDHLVAGGVVSKVDEAKCSGCRICVELCPYKAITFDEAGDHSEINEVLCKGCGVCAAACPSKAITIKGFRDEQIYAEIAAFLA